MVQGRKPTPSAVLKLKGRFFDKKHGDRLDLEQMNPLLKPPGDLDAQGKWLWGTVVDTLPAGVLAAIDTSLLYGACRWWSLWIASDQKAMDGDWKATCASAVAWKHFCASALQLGIGPIARAKIAKPAASKGDPLDEFTKKKRG